MSIGIIYCFIKSYLAIFGAHIELFTVRNDNVYGMIGWSGEEEKQDFLWEINHNENNLFGLILLCDYLINNKLIRGDVLLKSEEELISILESGLRWNKEKVVSKLNDLLDIEIKMIDEGEETDSFFLHF